MYFYIGVGLAGLCLFWVLRKWKSLQANISVAKASGIPYRISVINGIPGYLWIATHTLFLGLIAAFSPSRKWLWPKLCHVHRSWFYSQELREELGEVYLIVSLNQIFMSSSNAEANMSMISRRMDFVKLVEIYAIVDIFGSSILTVEGQDWKRHRKILAPAFSEKSSFGNGEDESQLGTKAVPGFNAARLTGKHTLTFKDSLNTLLHGIIWLTIFPVSFLRKSPFDIHKKLLRAYFECSDYFTELSDHKIRQIEDGEATEKGIMDIMGPLIMASERTPDDSKGTYLSKQEVIADSWITLFAGHETLQADIDSIIGSRSSDDWTYETDLGCLWNSMLGAAITKTLRLVPPIIDIPKIVRKVPQLLSYEEKKVSVPANTIIHISGVGVHRIPKYWPHATSKVSEKSHDLDEWIPERWLSPQTRVLSLASPATTVKHDIKAEILENTSTFDRANGLFIPVKGAFIPFSEGARACPRKRFAQVEIAAVMATLFKSYTLELDVREWASDKEVGEMSDHERRSVYKKAMSKAMKLIEGSQSEIFLQMRGSYPLRFVKRGSERFMRAFVDG